MILQDIGVGTIANDGTGDNPRAAALKINANNALIAAAVSGAVAGGAIAGTEKVLGLDGSTNKAWLMSQIATYVMALLIDSAPGTLDTLNELAAALGDDPNFAATMATSLAGKVSKAGDTITGDLAFGGTHRVIDLASPVSPGHAATKNYVDSGFQPLDADLTAIAALTTNSYGRALLALASEAAARAYLKAPGMPRARQFASGRYYVPFGYSGSSGTFPVSANILYALPWVTPMRASGITCKITTASASGNVRMALWDMNDTGNGGTLIEEVAAQSTASTGHKVGSFSASRDLDGRAGFITLCFDQACTINVAATSGANTHPVNGVADFSDVTSYSYFTGSLTYGAMPGTMPAMTLASATDNAPGIGLVGA